MKTLYNYSLYRDIEENDNSNVSQIILYLKNEEFATKEEIDLLNRINHVLELCEHGDSIIKNVIEMVIEDDSKFVRIAISNEQRMFSIFDNINNYKTMYIPDVNVEMDISEFKRYINDNGISTVFVKEYYDSLVNNQINKDHICNLIDNFYFDEQYEDEDDDSFDEEFYSEVAYKVIKDDINCFNNLLKKVDFEVPIKVRYLCSNGNLMLTSTKEYFCSLNADVLLFYILLMHFDEINKIVREKQTIIKERKRLKKQQHTERIKARLQEIRTRIINDPDFRVCTKKETMRYLKANVKNEKNDILEYLGLKRQRNGELIDSGYKACKFINGIWAEVHKK